MGSVELLHKLHKARKKAVRVGCGALLAYGARRAKLFPRKKKHSVRRKPHRTKEDVVLMKKSTFIALVVFLSAVVGAFAAAFVYLRRREAELDEYEQLLFSEDFSHEEGQDAPEEDSAPAESDEAAAAAHDDAEPAQA